MSTILLTIIILFVAAFIIYLIDRYVPERPLKTLFIVLIGVFLIVWLLKLMGFVNY